MRTIRARLVLATLLATGLVIGGCADESGTGAPSSSSGDADDHSGVSVALSSARSTFRANEQVLVTVTIRNDSDHVVRFLKWDTPAEDVEEQLFVLERDAHAVHFVGPHYKRPAPTAYDYITLAVGESLTRTVDLGAFYGLTQTGTYRVRYDHDQLVSNELVLAIDGRPNAVIEEEPGVAALTGNVTFTGRCSDTRIATLYDALDAASAMADNSAAYLAGTPSATQRYVTWFGAFTTSRWDTARQNFVAIKDAFDTKPLTLDCGCKKSYYAYVYPDRPYKIYVCRAFWNAPMTGTDSKGGTLIHEMSHFNAVAATDDHVYGQSGAKSLAASDPTKALNNADNHEYFAENTPFLP